MHVRTHTRTHGCSVEVGPRLWPVGYPLLCLGMLYWYSVPSIARRKVNQAEWRAYLEHMLSRFLDRGLALSGMRPDMEVADLTDANLRSILRVAHTAPISGGALTLAQRNFHRRRQKRASITVETGLCISQNSVRSAGSEIGQQMSLNARLDMDEPVSPDDYDSMTRRDLLAQINQNLREMKATGLLVLPMLVWGGEGQLDDERLAHRRMGFLLSLYRSEYWYFELFEMLRKILLISLLPSMVREGATSFLWGTFLLSFVALLATFSLKPFADPKLESLQLYTLTVTCLTIFYGMMLDHENIVTADPRESSVQVRHTLLLAVHVKVSHCHSP